MAVVAGGARDGGGSGRGDEPRVAPEASASPPPRDPDAASAAGEQRPVGSGTGPDVSSSPRQRGLAAAAAASATGELADSTTDDQAGSAADLPDDDEVDIDDLIDAPPESVKSPIDRLAEAFPGSELIEEAG